MAKPFRRGVFGHNTGLSSGLLMMLLLLLLMMMRYSSRILTVTWKRHRDWALGTSPITDYGERRMANIQSIINNSMFILLYRLTPVGAVMFLTSGV